MSHEYKQRYMKPLIDKQKTNERFDWLVSNQAPAAESNDLGNQPYGLATLGRNTEEPKYGNRITIETKVHSTVSACAVLQESL